MITIVKVIIVPTKVPSCSVSQFADLVFEREKNLAEIVREILPLLG
jgi:hypothetical protein